ncbi:MAG TPA: phosphonate C-P lyase system protein PhnH [Acetobacteraceae bacterium]|nr:phosphonate C-P lyase system protein PhnH [Acetobacteraceae bacterium]
MTDRAGFADPVLGAQSCFRAVLDAMARPGTRHAAGEGLSPPAPLGPAAAAVLLTLIDQDAPLCVPDDAKAARDWLAFHCGARFVPPAEASFLFATAMPDLGALNAGTHEAPEEGATLILQVARLGAGQRFRLRGPGIDGAVVLAVDGVPSDFAEHWAANRARFPRGIDLVLCAGTALAALPRGVAVEAL